MQANNHSDETTQTVADTVRALRKRAGFTQAELSKRTGLTQGFISELESGKRSRVSLGTVSKLAEAFNVPLSYFSSTQTADDGARADPAGIALWIRSYYGDPAEVNANGVFVASVIAWGRIVSGLGSSQAHALYDLYCELAIIEPEKRFSRPPDSQPWEIERHQAD